MSKTTSDIVEGGLALVGVPGPLLRVAKGVAGALSGGFEERLKGYQWDFLLEDIVALTAGVDRLNEWAEQQADRSGPTPADLAATFLAAERVSRKTSDDRKRALLRMAVRRAFEPDLYSKGLTLRVLGVLERLEYGDVHALREKMNIYWQSEQLVGQLDIHHLSVLIENSLASSIGFYGIPGKKGVQTAGEFVRFGGVVKPTALGGLVLAYLAED